MKHKLQDALQGHARSVRAFRSTIRWVLTAGLLTVTVWLISNQEPDFLSEVALDWRFLVPATWLLVLYTILVSERFRILTQLYQGRNDLSVRAFLRSLIVSRVLNGILPQAGNVYRASHLLNRIGLPWSGYLTIVMAGMVIDLIVIILVFGVILIDSHLFRIGLLHFDPRSHSGTLTLTASATVISVFLGIHLGKKHRKSRCPAQRTTGEKPVAALYRSILSRRNFPGLLLQSLVTITLLGTVLWLILLGMGFNPGLLGAATLLVAARLTQYIVITPGNLGVRELIYAAIGSQLAIGIGAAVSASILLRIMNWVVLGLLLLFSEGLSSCRGKRS